MRFFGKDDRQRADAARLEQRSTRASSGWTSLLQYFREGEGLRVLDFGPTSSGNINLITGLGHSVYMADVVSEARNPKWTQPDPDGTQTFQAAAFLQDNLNFAGRQFDVVLLWDTLDYLVPEAREMLVEQVHAVLAPGGRVLGLFHVKPESHFNRYHLREDGQMDVQPVSEMPVLETLSNRQIEAAFHAFSNYRFFLAKDNLREVLVTR